MGECVVGAIVSAEGNCGFRNTATAIAATTAFGAREGKGKSLLQRMRAVADVLSDISLFVSIIKCVCRSVGIIIFLSLPLIN
jgi:hypothetical protein